MVTVEETIMEVMALANRIGDIKIKRIVLDINDFYQLKTDLEHRFVMCGNDAIINTAHGRVLVGPPR